MQQKNPMKKVLVAEICQQSYQQICGWNLVNNIEIEYHNLVQSDVVAQCKHWMQAMNISIESSAASEFKRLQYLFQYDFVDKIFMLLTQLSQFVWPMMTLYFNWSLTWPLNWIVTDLLDRINQFDEISDG